MEIPKHPKIVWSGIHRGIRYEIVKWVSRDYKLEDESFLDDHEYSLKVHWNYYLYIPFKQLSEYPDLIPIPTTDEKDRVFYNYGTLDSMIDFHGGITHCSISNNNVLCIGCDYGHYRDIGYRFDEKYLSHDVEQTIKSIEDKLSKFKYFCYGNGNYYFLDEGTFNERGEFYSNEYIKNKGEVNADSV